MTTELATANSDTYLNPDRSIIVTMTGLILNGTPTETEWEELSEQLATYETARQWLLGDWYNACPWGNKKEACERFGIKYSTASTYARVAARFPRPQRDEALQFGHYHVLLEHDDPETKLLECKEQGITVSALRKALKEEDPDYVEPETATQRAIAAENRAAEAEARAQSWIERCQALNREMSELRFELKQSESARDSQAMHIHDLARTIDKMRDGDAVIQERDALAGELAAVKGKLDRLRKRVAELEGGTEPTPPKPNGKKRTRRGIQAAEPPTLGEQLFGEPDPATVSQLMMCDVDGLDLNPLFGEQQPEPEPEPEQPAITGEQVCARMIGRRTSAEPTELMTGLQAAAELKQRCKVRVTGADLARHAGIGTGVKRARRWWADAAAGMRSVQVVMGGAR